MLTEFWQTLFPPKPFAMARDELIEAQRELLKAETAVEFSEAMAAYQLRRVIRLKARVADGADEARKELA
jgi:hypothetical protein